MAKTIRTYTSNGIRTTYPVDFSLGYIDKGHIYIYDGNDYLDQLEYSWATDTQIELEVPPEIGVSFNIRRVVPRDRLINNYEDGAILHEQNLDDSHLQHLMILEELDDEEFVGLPPTETVDEIIEEQVLASGQVVVVFTNAVQGATFHLAGDFVDTGRLGVDDIVATPNTSLSVTLTNSYPAGTKLVLTKTERKLLPDIVEEAPNDTRAFARKSLGWVETLDDDHANGTRTHAEIDTAIDTLNSTVVTQGNSIVQIDSNVSDNTDDIDTNTLAIAALVDETALLAKDNANNQVGTTYTLIITDTNKTVWMKSASANVLIIPDNATAALPVHSILMVMMEDVGETTIQAVGSVTLNGVLGGSGVLTQFNGVALVKRDTNTWVATPLEVA